RADPRQERPALRQSRGRADDDEGPAALVPLRPAGGQGALLRLGGHAGGRARRAATAARLADLPHRSHARRRRRALRHRHRPRRLSRPQGPALPPGPRRRRQGRASGARARRRTRGAAARGAARVLAAHRGRRPRRPDGGGLAAGARGHGRHRARRRAEGARRGTRARGLVSAGRRRAAALAAAALAVLALDACGRRGSPLPPEIRVPQAVSDLTAVEREGGIEVAWTVPSRRADHSRTLGPPEAPQALRGEAGDHAARLSWQPPAKLADGTPVTDPLAYEVLRAGDVAAEPSPIGRTAPGVTSFEDRGLENDRTYYYAVRAIRAAGAASAAGEASPRVAVTPVKSTPPAPVTDVVALPSRGHVPLSWTPTRE